MKTSSDPRILWIILLVLPLTAMAVLACATHGAAAESADNPDGLRVTVLIYSGRPNPSFLLEDEAMIDRLREYVDSAEVREDFDRGTVLPSILGYNGLRVDNLGGEAGLPRTLLLYGGVAEIHDGGKRFVTDAGRELERALVDRAAERGAFGEDERALEIIRESLRGTDTLY